MPYKKSLENKGTYVLVTVSGRVTLENEMDLECYLDLVCEQESPSALITDVRGTSGILSRQEALSLASEIGEYHRRVKEAIVDMPDREHINNEYAAKASHRGFEIRSFYNMTDAIQWLTLGNVHPFPEQHPGA